MQEARYITIISNRRKIVLNVSTILYALKVDKCIEIHVSGERVYDTRMIISELEQMLGESFIKVHRGCIVSIMAIHDITDKINLSNGESLIYTLRKKKELIEQFHTKQKSMISSFIKDDMPATKEEYHEYYRSFDNVPFAFADIEMIFDEEHRAVDWIFRYGNPALARLEKLPLEKLIGNSFGSLFANMDSKWCRSYERATLYGEKLEILDYSPEIDTYLKVTCFPTFKGHCGCILFNTEEIEFIQSSNDVLPTE
ncbi:MAG: LytTR family DNA-binding domain-containing protein [Lachnospiraceae bacterium]|nr:LytTR family DNA-binding domain-containing protein [Lachnospiraceae bacterium]